MSVSLNQAGANLRLPTIWKIAKNIKLTSVAAFNPASKLDFVIIMVERISSYKYQDNDTGNAVRAHDISQIKTRTPWIADLVRIPLLTACVINLFISVFVLYLCIRSELHIQREEIDLPPNPGPAYVQIIRERTGNDDVGDNSQSKYCVDILDVLEKKTYDCSYHLSEDIHTLLLSRTAKNFMWKLGKLSARK